MRLTTDLLQSAPSYLNPLNDRELDLRGHKIPAIENLGVAGPQDAIDLTENTLTSLSNFPQTPRLKTLLLARNRIRSIQANLSTSLPNLTVLALSSNNLSELADLDPLAGFARLTHLSLLDNPVTRRENYRLWVVWRCPSVRFLDYAKVKEAERVLAARLFGSEGEPTALAARIMGVKSKTFDVGEPLDGGQKEYTVRLSADEKKSIEARIKSARSLEEVARLERELREGPQASGDSMEM